MSDWTAANQAYLIAAVARVQALLERHLSGEGDPVPAAPEPAMEPPPALERLSAAFGLSAFERDVLVMCAGMELNSGLAAAVALSGGSAPTFGLALAAFPEAFWSALAPAAPLRYWRLVELAALDSLTSAPLRVDERILHYLAGVGGVDERLMAIVEPAAAAGALPRSHQDAADAVTRAWSVPSPVPALLCLCGDERAGKRAVASAACEQMGLRLYVARAADLPAAATEREATARLWEREAVLGGCALLVEVEDGDGPETARAVAAYAERIRAPLLVSAREPVRTATRTPVRLDVDRPAPVEQRALWYDALGPAAASLNGALDGLVAQFHLGAREIRLAGAQALAEGGDSGLGGRLWEACRAQARPRLDDLAERIRGGAGWDDLVLPDDQARTLRDVVTHVRHRTRVYEQWGFGRSGARGLGISALFAGPSGTGKTLAAEVVANELGLDLYRIDLSQVVSKYIGETEKNLRRVFDAAEEGGAVLLFDEADALFGKRSEVKDSHDRYANIEVSYLLQRMEAYRGLAVLTTNLKASIDTAFLRRIRFVVNFPFPDAVQRAGIWQRAFPPATPTDGLDAARLARLNVAGGNIRNIALGAAFLAAGADRPVRMEDVLRAARGEYEKLERAINPGEIAGWEKGSA